MCRNAILLDTKSRIDFIHLSLDLSVGPLFSTSESIPHFIYNTWLLLSNKDCVFQRTFFIAQSFDSISTKFVLIHFHIRVELISPRCKYHAKYTLRTLTVAIMFHAFSKSFFLYCAQ